MAEWEKKNAPPKRSDARGRVGDRRYARGRATIPTVFDRKDDAAGAENSAERIRSREGALSFRNGAVTDSE